MFEVPKKTQKTETVSVLEHYGEEPKAVVEEFSVLGDRGAEDVGETIEDFPHGSHPDVGKVMRGAVEGLPPEVARTALDSLLLPMARVDLGMYMWFVHGLKPFPHQEIWAAWLMARGVRRKTFLTPTGHGKTQVVSQANNEWEIGRNPDLARLQYISNTPAQATKVSRSVMRTIEFNPNFHKVFPHVVKDDSKWGQDAFLVRRAAQHTGLKDDTFVAAGVDGPINGLRTTGQTIDDASDLQNTATKYMAAKVTEFFEQIAILRIIEPHGWLNAVMTRFNDLDVFPWLCSLKGMVVIHMPALGFWEHADEQLSRMGGGAIVGATKKLLDQAGDRKMELLKNTAAAEGLRFKP